MTDNGISVLKIRDMLLGTVPSDPGDDVVEALQEKTLEAMKQHEAKGLVLDISMVETMDSYFARSVAESAQMIALMGGRTVIVGMRPSVAITATELGLSLEGVLTALDVDRALEMLGESPTGNQDD